MHAKVIFDAHGPHYALCTHPAPRPSGASAWLARLAGRIQRFLRKDPLPEVPSALNWVDEFIARVRPYIAVRLADNLLIRMPNQAHRLNPAGARVLHYLLAGGTVAELVRASGSNTRRLQDVALFLYEIRRCLSGDLREDNASCAVEITPLTPQFTHLPVLAEIAVTQRCNLRCIFCYAACGATPSDCATAAHHSESTHFSTTPDDGPEADRVPTRQLETLLTRMFQQAQVPSISFTGGEPTLRRDLPHLVRYAAKTLGMRVNLISNGTRITAGLAGQLADAGLASAQISLAGPNAASHDAITRLAGSFECSCQAVAHLQAAGISVHANTTINRHNQHLMAGMPRFAREVLKCDRLSMNMIIPAGRATAPADNSHQTPLLHYREIVPVVEAVQQASAQAGIEFLWYAPTPLCIFNPITAKLGNKGCSACDGLLSVKANGDVLPCSSCDDPVGNLLQDDFQGIWHRHSARCYRHKKLAHPGCRACAHFAFCHGACPLYWKHFGFDELVQVRGFAPAPPPAIPVPRTSSSEV